MSKHIDHILSIIDNLFGEDDNSPVPSPMQMRNSGFGDAHDVVHPEHTCIQIVEPVTNPAIQKLEAQLMELFEAGHEISRDGASAYETRQEWLDVLNGIHEQQNNLFLQIADLCGNYVARFESNNNNCMSCGVGFSYHG